MTRRWNYLASSFLGLTLLHTPIQCLHGQDGPLPDPTVIEPEISELGEGIVLPPIETAPSWTLERRERDPVGFAEHVEEVVRVELCEMRRAQTTLRGELAELNGKRRVLETDQAAAQLAAEELRDLHHVGVYPVSFEGRDLADPAAVTARVSLLLAEEDGRAATLRKLRNQIRAAQQQFEELTVQINHLDAQVATVRTQRARLLVSWLPSDAEQLLGQLGKLLPRISRQPTQHEQRVAVFMTSQQTAPAPAKLKEKPRATPAKLMFQQF